MFKAKLKLAVLAIMTLVAGIASSGRAAAAPDNSLIVGTWTATAPGTGGAQKNVCLVLDTKYTATWHESVDGGKTWTPFSTTYTYANNVLTLNFPQAWTGALLIGNTVDADNRIASFTYAVTGQVSYVFQRSPNKLHDLTPQNPAQPVVPQPEPKPQPQPEPKPEPKPQPKPQPEMKEPAAKITSVKLAEVVEKGLSVVKVTVQASVENLKGQECVAVMVLLDEKGAALKTLDGKEVALSVTCTPKGDSITLTTTFTVAHQVLADLLDPEAKKLRFAVAIGDVKTQGDLASKECEAPINIPESVTKATTPTNVPTPANKP